MTLIVFYLFLPLDALAVTTRMTMCFPGGQN